MDNQYINYATARLEGDFNEMSSFKFVRPYLEEKRVIDIGCSDGLYLQHMRSDSVGIEQIPELAKSCQQKIGRAHV
jgi:2-polyprenyl-3-methyl-5-hydroxy-6-metoxy-1,4-benzoquinol methylase